MDGQSSGLAGWASYLVGWASGMAGRDSSLALWASGLADWVLRSADWTLGLAAPLIPIIFCSSLWTLCILILSFSKAWRGSQRFWEVSQRVWEALPEGLRGPSRGAGGSSEETESRSFPVWYRCPKRRLCNYSPNQKWQRTEGHFFSKISCKDVWRQKVGTHTDDKHTDNTHPSRIAVINSVGDKISFYKFLLT